MTNEIFNAFINEASFTKELLGIGATEIRKAIYSNKGIYYNSFNCLSTGFERIAKLCIILDYYIKNNGQLPNFDYIKNNFGHNLTKLYEGIKDISIKHNIKFKFKNNLDEEIYTKILSVLSDFAKSDRYTNINVLSNSKSTNDSILNWYNNIDNYIYDNCIKQAKKMKIENNAEIIGRILAPISYINFTNENNENMKKVKEASIQTGKIEAVAPYRQLYVLQMIRYFTELLIKLADKAREIDKTELKIPYFEEIFAGFYNSDSYFKSRKTWDTI